MNNGELPGFKTAAYYRSFQTTFKRSLDAIKTRMEAKGMLTRVQELEKEKDWLDHGWDAEIKMREIKFRGKAVMSTEELDVQKISHKNGWVYGNLVMKENEPYIVGNIVEVTDEYITPDFWVRVIPETVGQFTGLLDKTGKEIYEGDIDTDEYGNLNVVCYIKKYGAYCFVPLELYVNEDYENEVMYEYGYDCFFHNIVPSEYAEIIGNIFQDGDLFRDS